MVGLVERTGHIQEPGGGACISARPGRQLASGSGPALEKDATCSLLPLLLSTSAVLSTSKLSGVGARAHRSHD